MRTISLLLLAVGFVGVVAFAELKDSAATDRDKIRPGSGPLTKEDQSALELGRKVLAIQGAIERPQAPGSMDAVRDLGLDHRYYVMVRGWLDYQLKGDRSIRDARRESSPPTVRDRIAFLEKAIRAIDLDR